jgi:adhesin transport system membrane fusion protein
MTTVDGAVSPSAPILDIVPMDAPLFLKAKFNPKDVAYIHPGLRVSIKLSAYDSQVFGELDGVVETVSPDTFRDEPRPTERTDNGYYRVMSRAELKRNKPEQKILK